MDDLRKAAQAALEALEGPLVPSPANRHKVIADLRAALAQPQPQAEPVQCERCGHTNWVMEGKAPCQITEEDRGALVQPQAEQRSVALDDDGLAFLRTKLKNGEYNGVDIMHAWLAIDELRAWRDKAFQAPPSINHTAIDEALKEKGNG